MVATVKIVNPFGLLTDADKKRLQRLIAEPGLDFNKAVKILRLRPERDFRYANLSGLDFEDTDLSGYDLTGARLEGCNFFRAKLPLSMRGRRDLQFKLAAAIEDGSAGGGDMASAVYWYLQSATKGNLDAAVALAVLSRSDGSTEQGLAVTVELLRKAAEVGDARAMFELGNCYKDGRGVEADAKVAVRWYRKAAEAAHAAAMFNLGGCYEQGRGVEVDAQEAVRWYRQAGEAGHVGARLPYALLSALGFGHATTFPQLEDAALPLVAIDGLWTDSPPLKSNWSELDASGARMAAWKLVHTASLEGSPSLFAGLVLTAARSASLSCYPGLEFVDVQFVSQDGKPRLVSALLAAQGAILLDGTAQRLQLINPFCLDLVPQGAAEDYLRAFCTFIRGPAGPFQIVDSLADVPFGDAAAADELSLAGHIPSPPQISSADNGMGHSARAWVLHHDVLSECEFSITASGQVSMDDDRAIAGDLPVLVRSYDGVFRTPLHDNGNDPS